MGSCPLVFPVWQLCSDQISFGPLPPMQNQPYSQHWWYLHQCQESFVSGRSQMAWIECLYTGFPMKMLYRHDMMWKQIHRPTQISKALGKMLFCHNAKFQYLYGSWFLIVLELHLSGTGMSSSACSPSSTESGLVDPGLTSSYWFDAEVGMLPVNFWLASWPVMHPPHVALEWVHYYHLPHSIFIFFHSRLLLMGNR